MGRGSRFAASENDDRLFRSIRGQIRECRGEIENRV